MISDVDEQYILGLLQLEHWQAYKRAIEADIKAIEEREEALSKICDDPLLQDFRVQLGIKIGLKRALRKPQDILEKQQYKGD